MYVKYELSFPYDIFSLETDRPNDRQTHTCSYIYINVPSNSEADSGNLVVSMGEESDVKDVSENPTTVINVNTGDLVLFPASLTHSTIPFEAEEERIVLAFDVIPKLLPQNGPIARSPKRGKIVVYFTVYRGSVFGEPIFFIRIGDMIEIYSGQVLKQKLRLFMAWLLGC